MTTNMEKAVGVLVILAVLTFWSWFISGLISTNNGTWSVAYDQCVGDSWLSSNPANVGFNSNPYAIITGDYYFDCTKDLTTTANGATTIETQKLKTIHVRKTLW